MKLSIPLYTSVQEILYAKIIHFVLIRIFIYYFIATAKTSSKSIHYLSYFTFYELIKVSEIDIDNLINSLVYTYV